MLFYRWSSNLTDGKICRSNVLGKRPEVQVARTSGTTYVPLTENFTNVWKLQLEGLKVGHIFLATETFGAQTSEYLALRIETYTWRHFRGSLSKSKSRLGESNITYV
jgi:hypothetical protein